MNKSSTNQEVVQVNPNLVEMAADNLVNFYNTNVRKDSGNCPTFSQFLNTVYNAVYTKEPANDPRKA